MSNSSAFQMLVMPPSLAWLADAEVQADEALNQALRDLGFAITFDMPECLRNPACHTDIKVVLCIHKRATGRPGIANHTPTGVQVYELVPGDNSASLAQQMARLGLRNCPVPMQNFDHDNELLNLTLQAILTESPGLLAQALDTGKSTDTQALRRLIHTLKGHTKLLGENALAGALQALEDRASRGEFLTEEQAVLMKDNLDVFFSRLRLMTQTH